MCSLQEHIERDIRAREAAKAETVADDEAEAQSEQRSAYWGTCDECLITVIVYPHPDRAGDIPEDEHWEAPFATCPLCDNSVDWEGADPVRDIIRNY
ncbi:hypothetical protein SEA_GUSANITA_59 [Arthrobacter phage Gusanita]|nr:hypothetical protein SEA_GUSANITA_59 [Arthrobacter phage Gusanita]